MSNINAAMLNKVMRVVSTFDDQFILKILQNKPSPRIISILGFAELCRPVKFRKKDFSAFLKVYLISKDLLNEWVTESVAFDPHDFNVK